MLLLHVSRQGDAVKVQKSGGPQLMGSVGPSTYCCLELHFLGKMNWIHCLSLVERLCYFWVIRYIRDLFYEALSYLMHVDRRVFRASVGLLLL